LIILVSVKTDRNTLAILAEFLERAGTTSAKTRVLNETGVTHKMVNRYLSLMVGARLMEQVPFGTRASFQVSDKGKRFLQLYHEIETLLETDEGKKCLTKNGVKCLPKGLPARYFSPNTH